MMVNNWIIQMNAALYKYTDMHSLYSIKRKQRLFLELQIFFCHIFYTGLSVSYFVQKSDRILFRKYFPVFHIQMNSFNISNYATLNTQAPLKKKGGKNRQSRSTATHWELVEL